MNSITSDKEKEFVVDIYYQRIKDLSDYRALNKLRKIIKKDRKLDKLQKSILDGDIDNKLGHYYTWIHWEGDEFAYHFDYKFNKGYGFQVVNSLTKKKMSAGDYVQMLKEYMGVMNKHYDSVYDRTTKKQISDILFKDAKEVIGVNKRYYFYRDKIREADKKDDDGKSLYKLSEEIYKSKDLGTQDKDDLIVDISFLLGHFYPNLIYMNSVDKDSVAYNWFLDTNEGYGYSFKHKKTGKVLSAKGYVDMVNKYCRGVIEHYNKVYVNKTAERQRS